MSGQIWSVNVLGGYMESEHLSDILRTNLQPLSRFRQMCDVKDAIGTGKGDQFHWNVYSDVETEGSQLNETQVMPETNFTITQGTLTIDEYGNSVPYTGKLDNLSEHPVKELIKKVLKNDATKTLDRAAYNQFNSTVVTIGPTGGTATDSVAFEVGGATITNNVAMGADHIKAIVDGMKERNVTPFDGQNYMSLARPSTLRNFKNDYETIKQYSSEGFGYIFRGEVGRYEGVRFIEQTNIASEGWSNSQSDAAFFFGEDTVAEGIAVNEEIRGKLPGDYGRSKGVAWYYLGGFGIVHNSADGVQSRIFKWDSAA